MLHFRGLILMIISAWSYRLLASQKRYYEVLSSQYKTNSVTIASCIAHKCYWDQYNNLITKYNYRCRGLDDGLQGFIWITVTWIWLITTWKEPSFLQNIRRDIWYRCHFIFFIKRWYIHMISNINILTQFCFPF